ncbi:TPA: hypothetical protein ACH3X2_002617 [Trebouxia sp. C0005]
MLAISGPTDHRKLLRVTTPLTLTAAAQGLEKSMTVGAGLTSTQWAQSAYTIAKARHREVTSKGMSDANKLSLEQRLHGLTRHFSMASNSGQAAVMVIDLCAEFAYECLAIGYDMRSNSDTLSTMITQ